MRKSFKYRNIPRKPRINWNSENLNTLNNLITEGKTLKEIALVFNLSITQASRMVRKQNKFTKEARRRMDTWFDH